MGSRKSLKTQPPTKSRLKKDPGVPRLPDLKAKASLKQTGKNSQRSHKGNDEDKMQIESTLLQSLPLEPEEQHEDSSAHARRHYIRTLYKVIDQSDVVVLVLDARDPEGCRSRLVEEEVRRREVDSKKLMFVLNKIDLVPRSNVEAWLRHLRHTAPTVAFRASTQQQRTNISSKTSIGLLNALKSFKSPSRTLTVGIVGYPNVGKSSVINSLKRAKVCAVAAEPGWTKEMQAVQIERGIKILDSPGVVFESQDFENQNLLLRNVVKVDEMRDPIAVASSVYDRITPTEMSRIYSLPEPTTDDPTNVHQFLVQLALTSGRLLKSGVPDLESTARGIIRDWNAHKLPFFSEPPKIHPSSIPGFAPDAADVGNSAIVSGGFSEVFELGGLWDSEVTSMPIDLVDQESPALGSGVLQTTIPRRRSISPIAQDELPQDYKIDNDDASRPSKRQCRDGIQDSEYEMSFMEGGNPVSRKAQKRQSKRSRKDVQRQKRHLMEVVEVEESSVQPSFIFSIAEESATDVHI